MRVLKTEIPVDGLWHDVAIGSILHVGTQSHDTVAIWWMEDGLDLRERRFRAYGTGHTVHDYDTNVLRPVRPVWVGTAVVSDRKLVWHLFEDVL